MFKIRTFYLLALYMWWLASYLYVESTCMTTSFLEKWGFGSMKLV